MTRESVRRAAVRVLYLGEGSSDAGIGHQVEALAAGVGIPVTVTSPDLSLLPQPPGKVVADMLAAVRALGGMYDLLVLHRDGDGDGRAARVHEIGSAVASEMPGVAHVPVVPIRMTEAWLLLDEQLIREVAGNPRGRVPLNLPSPRSVEKIVDAKARLQAVLATASELSGRRLQRFQQRFFNHRRQLLERLDPAGPVSRVPSWQHFVNDLTTGLSAFR